jgi:hypothetical protein
MYDDVSLMYRNRKSTFRNPQYEKKNEQTQRLFPLSLLDLHGVVDLLGVATFVITNRSECPIQSSTPDRWKALWGRRGAQGYPS